jgi:hypothetical protein
MRIRIGNTSEGGLKEFLCCLIPVYLMEQICQDDLWIGLQVILQNVPAHPLYQRHLPAKNFKKILGKGK